MAFKKGKSNTISEKLEGYEKLDKSNIDPKEGILIDNVVKGYSEDNGDYIYVTGSYMAKPVYVSVPAASIEDFITIDPTDLEEIRRDGLKLYIESRISKKGRQYFLAYIDD